MSVRDLPDYTRQVVIRYEGGFIGLEELAARLGSIVPYDLRGNIILMEDFESEETEWTLFDAGPNSTASRSSRHKYSGDWSLKLYNAGATYSVARGTRYFHFPGIGKYAAFARFCWDNDCHFIYFCLVFLSATRTFYMTVRYNYNTHTLSVVTTGGVYYDVDTNLYLGESKYIWYPILVTFNLATCYYDKLYFADKEYDISSVAPDYEDISSNPYSFIEVFATRRDGHSCTVYVDDIIIAKNVP